MASMPIFTFQAADPSQNDDIMELATSPYPQNDEIDFEIEQIHEETAESINEMMDDAIESGEHIQQVPQHDYVGDTKDEKMSDGEHNVEDIDFTNDFDMDHYEESNTVDDDEEIFYDEEGEAGHLTGATDGDQKEQEIDDTVVVHISDNGEVHTEQMSTAKSPTDDNVDDREAYLQDAIEHPTEHEEAHNVDDSLNETADISNVETETLESNHEEIADSHDALPHNSNDATTSIPAAHEIDVQDSSASSRIDFVNGDGRATIHPQSAPEHQNVLPDNESSVSKPAAQQLQQELAVSQDEVRLGEDDESKDERSELTTQSAAVKLFYLGEEMFLFPPENEDAGTFFLSDINLAFEALNKLLEACREILTGSLEHDDELVLDVPALGLHICEDSKYATQITMTQVVDVYISLNRNENTSPVEPLYCTLSTRVSLASQYAYLAGAAREGKTFSEIAADYVDTPLKDFRPDPEIMPDEEGATPDTEHPFENPSNKSLSNETILDEQNGAAFTTTASEYSPSAENHHTNQQLSPSTSFTIPTTSVNNHAGEESAKVDNAPDPSLQDYSRKTSDTEELHEDLGAAEGSESKNQFEDQSSSTVPNGIAVPDQARASPLANEEEEPYLEGEEEISQFEQPYHYDHDQDGEEDDLTEDHEHELDEDIFADTDGIQASSDAPQTLSSDEKSLQPQATQTDAEAGEENTNGKQEFDNIDLLTDPVVTNTPLTPAKAKTIKRKAIEEEDEFHLLDTGTPEPKRRRPS